MSNDTSRNRVTGLVGLLALVLLLAGVFWGKRYHPWRPEFKLSVEFPGSGGMQTGDAVYLNGVIVGSIRSLDLKKHHVVLHLAVPRSIPITNDARYRIESTDLMGGKGIMIINGTGALIQEDQQGLTGELTGGLRSLLMKSSDLVSEVTSLSREIRNLLNDVDGLDRLIASSTETVERGGSMVNDLAARLPTTLNHLDLLLEDLHLTVSEIKPGASQMVNRVNATVSDLQLLTRDIHRQLDQSGLLQKALSDSLLYGQVQKTVLHLDSLVQSIRQHGLIRFHKKD